MYEKEHELVWIKLNQWPVLKVKLTLIWTNFQFRVRLLLNHGAAVKCDFVQNALIFDRNSSCLNPPSHEQIFIHYNFFNLCNTSFINLHCLKIFTSRNSTGFWVARAVHSGYVKPVATGTNPVIRYEHNYMIGFGQWLDCGWDGRGIWVHLPAETESERPLGSNHPRIQRAIAVCNQGFKQTIQ